MQMIRTWETRGVDLRVAELALTGEGQAALLGVDWQTERVRRGAVEVSGARFV